MYSTVITVLTLLLIVFMVWLMWWLQPMDGGKGKDGRLH